MIHSDNHVHTSFSSDSDTPMERMLQEAIRQGYSSICFTDHLDLDFPDMGNGMDFMLDIDAYRAEIKRLSAVYPDIEIRTGIEIGLKPDLAGRYREMLGPHPFDFIIGSTHLVDNMDPYYPEFWSLHTERDGVRRYYEITLDNIRSGTDFDVYGHLDYIVRYVPSKTSFRMECMDYIDEILRELISRGKGLECNTAGIKYGLPHPNPCPEVLQRYRELGGEIITIGADGHRPEHFAYAFDRVADILKGAGFTRYAEFHHRSPVWFDL